MSRESRIENQEIDYIEEAAKAFYNFFVIRDTDYDLFRTPDGNYFCRDCATKVKRSHNCPNCNKNIDWSKMRVSVENLLKGDKSDTDPRPIGEFRDKVINLPDNQLTSLHEELFDNPKKQNIELIKATTWEVFRRYVLVSGFFNRWFKRKEYNKWTNLRKRIGVKAMKFVIEAFFAKRGVKVTLLEEWVELRDRWGQGDDHAFLRMVEIEKELKNQHNITNPIEWLRLLSAQEKSN